MARVIFSPFIESIRGTLGNVVFRVNGNTAYISERQEPKPPPPPTPKQTAARKETRKAGNYGKRALADPKLRPVYEAIAKATGKPVVSMANRDYWHKPVVHTIDAADYTGHPGDVITITATDDTGVVKVDVQLTGPDGTLLEKGPAVLDQGDRWLYTTQSRVPTGTRVRIAATAIDRPEGTGLLELEVDL